MSKATVYKPRALKGLSSASNRSLLRVGKMINRPLSKLQDEVSLVREGVPATAVDKLVSSTVVTMSEVRWIISARTLARRKENGENLTLDESGRWVRAAKLSVMAEEVFGDKIKAEKWLHKPRKVFGGEPAILVMQTEAGAKLVEDSLNQIDSGYFA